MSKVKASVAMVAGKKLHCRNWQIEGAYRMLHNVLDPEVAKDHEHLIIYGGTGKAARSWACFEAITQTLRELQPNENHLQDEGVDERR